MNNSVQHVVFDIGNVLIEWNPDFLFRKLIPDSADRQDFLTRICSPEWNLEQDRGRSWQEATETLCAQHPDKAGLIRAYSERWHEMVPGEVPGTSALLAKLKGSSIPLYAITNFSSEKFAEAQERFPFLKTSFLDIVVSAEERLLKPDPQIYQVLLARNGLTPQTCLFIDDSLPNIVAANELGMRGHHFKSADILETELVSHGLIVR